MEKKEILVVSFGTSQKEARERAIGGIEQAIAAAFPDYEVKRAFTSGMVIRHIEKDEGLHIPTPVEAIRQAAAEGVQELVIQPTHMMAAQEYDKLVSEVEPFRLSSGFSHLTMGMPVLTTDDDYSKVISTLRWVTKDYDDGHTAIILVGHGTEHKNNAVYSKMQKMLETFGYNHYFVGTVESSPSLDDVRAAVEAGGCSRIVLVPMLIVAGEHALKDIGGEQPGSWYSIFRQDEYEVIRIKKGLGEYEGIQKLLVEHVKDAMGPGCPKQAALSNCHNS